MDFVTHFLRSLEGHDSIWVIEDTMTKYVHFSPINQQMSLEKLAELYICEIVWLHGVLASIVLDRDLRFKTRFWQTLQKALGNQRRLSSTYHS